MYYTEEDIASAIEAGIFTEETASAFRDHVAKDKKRQTPVDGERFRLVTGFNDIFVAIACLLVLVSVGWIGAAAAPWIGAIAVSAAAWSLAEFFVRQRRMALPAIVLSLAFIGSIPLGWALLAEGIRNASLVATSASASFAAWLHWRRFRVPITIAAGTGTVLAWVIALLIMRYPEAKNWLIALTFMAGLTVFALALRWDATDVARQTWRSDVAFWLHLLAAPLLVHPLFTSLGVLSRQTTSIGQVIAVMTLYMGLALIALCIDRRALMVSALAYVLYAFSTLLKQHGVVSLNLAVAAFVIGSALLLLSALWHDSRRHVLKLLPLAVRKRFPPLR